MTEPFARPTATDTEREDDETFAPQAFSPSTRGGEIEPYFDPDPEPETLPLPPRRRNWLARIAWTAGGILVSLAIGLAIDRLVRDLFAANPWLGWAGLGLAAVFAVAIVALTFREYLSLRRLKVLDRLRERAGTVLISDKRDEGRAVIAELQAVYHARPDLSRARLALDTDVRDLFDGAQMVKLAERRLMAPLDARAKAMTGAAARRVALVTAVSPRALVDIAFVAYESVRLAGAIARLYGARPGLFGSVRLIGAVLSHLAVTGGLALTDGAIEQLVGQGLAAKISTRLGEGLVNGLMTARVGIAAMRVARPLPFETQRQPMVKDYIAELGNLGAKPRD